ncbi:MAG: hypothetical protein OXF27_08225 [Acidobacteria bacterium]|nr:hypothetical protein [Acidobacteriota bacterium]
MSAATTKRRRRTKRGTRKLPAVRTFGERAEAEAEARKLSAPIIHHDFRNGMSKPPVFLIEAATGFKRRSMARGWLRVDGKIR